MADEKKVEETVEVDEKFVKAVGDAILPQLSETIKDAIALATEKTVKKEIGDAEEAEAAKVTAAAEAEEAEKATESKELRFLKASYALARGDMETVKRYNKIALAERAKAAYGNITTDADGAYLVPNPDFDAEVERLEVQYGVAFQYADVRQVYGNSVKLNKKAGGFEFTEVSEHAAKTGVKFSIGQVTADLRKFSAIAPATEELDEDSAIDYWAEVTTEFARARAKKADELVFTDATSGILEVANTAALTIGDGLEHLTWDNLLDAEVKVPTPSQQNGAWFMHRTIWNKLIQTKAATTGEYQFQPNPSAKATPWGTPVVLTEILPASSAVGANTAFAVFGDLKNTKLYTKRGLQLTILTEATIKDSNGDDFNLALQGGKALLGQARMLNVVKFPEAFCLVGTGTVS